MKPSTAIARALGAAALLIALSGCWSPTPPVAAGSFRFAVFGDAPYYAHENGRARRVFDAMNARPLEFVIHIGDIMWQHCTDEAYRARRELVEIIRHPVIYTPGDNEWLDCVDIAWSVEDPLERLANLRAVFFAPADRSLGKTPIAVETQSADPQHAEFVENARWAHGEVTFVTIHVVGSANGLRPFRGRTARHDEEVARRTQAAVDWLGDSFRAAGAVDAAAVVVAMHANPTYAPTEAEHVPYAPIEDALVELARAFGKPVLVIHGDEHRYTADRPFKDYVTGETIANMYRLETFGSPYVGWVDVVVDTTSSEAFRFEPNVTPRWMWW